MSDPWFKFYPTDWQADPALRMCSAGARGLWIEIICLMHNASPYGHLLVNGQSPTDTQLGVLAGIPTDQITALLGELETAGVFSRTRAGVIYSCKMTRSARKAATARNNGRKGGNPALRKQKEKSASDNPDLKAGDKPRSQKPEPELDITPDVSSSNEESTSGTSLPLEISDREFIWSSGIDLLTRNGIQERSARSFLGMQIKTAGGAAAGEKIVATAITAAMQAGSGDPQAYIVQTVKSEKRKPVIREEETEEPTALRKSADGKFLEKIRQSDGVVILRQPLEVAA